MKMHPSAPPTRRIVLQHPDGLMQILGHAPTQPPEVMALPIEGAEPLVVNLVAVKPRYYLYKPMLEKPGLLKFNEHQQ